MTFDLRLLSRFIEQELCARAHTFIGSKYSTWTDTVSGMRIHEERSGNQRPGNNWLFEELYQLECHHACRVPFIHTLARGVFIHSE